MRLGHLGRGTERPAQVDGLRRDEQLDGEAGPHVLHHRRALSAAVMPIETWSSRPAEDGMESTLAGWAEHLVLGDQRRARHLGDHVAGVEPGVACARKGGSPESDGFTSCSTRRSEMVARWEAAMASTSSARDTGWPWKFPPETMSPASAKTRGLSVAALTSRARTPAAEGRCRRAPRRAPGACSGASRGPGPGGSRAPGARRSAGSRRAGRAGARRRRPGRAGRAPPGSSRHEGAVGAEQPLERHGAGEVGHQRQPLGPEQASDPDRRPWPGCR